MPEDTWFAFSFGDGMCETDIIQFVAPAPPEVPFVNDMYSYNSTMPPFIDE